MVSSIPELSPSEWNVFLKNYPHAHILQTVEWGNLKAAFGWEVVRLATEAGNIGAQVLFRRLPLGFTLGYIPKGPIGEQHQSTLFGESWFKQEMDIYRDFWMQVDRLCRHRRAVFLKVEPDLWERNHHAQSVYTPKGFRLSHHAIQPPRTLIVDLRDDEQHILARMKQKTRYNIRLAIKKGVMVKESDDLDLFYRLMQITGKRDQFGIHHPSYYRAAFNHFHPIDGCRLFIAEYFGEPLAAIMVFVHGARAWYFYGASSDEYREFMPTYLLQWEAMRWAKQRSCLAYDLWGVPDERLEVLEAQFTNRSDGLWGIYRFKRGFGGQLMRSQGPWDRVYQPVLYAFYQWWYRKGQVD
jgi:lipid II:glycine glycyltransferase (peptidoglycan interpeptide bridge formation enzyme)